MNWSSMA